MLTINIFSILNFKFHFLKIEKLHPTLQLFFFRFSNPEDVTAPSAYLHEASNSHFIFGRGELVSAPWVCPVAPGGTGGFLVSGTSLAGSPFNMPSMTLRSAQPTGRRSATCRTVLTRRWRPGRVIGATVRLMRGGPPAEAVPTAGTAAADSVRPLLGGLKPDMLSATSMRQPMREVRQAGSKRPKKSRGSGV